MPEGPSTALAIAAHPDDIEFIMAGTLIRLREKGWDIHVLNLSTGNLGSADMDGHQTAETRVKEAQAAARMLDATWHPPISNDLEIFYDLSHLRQLAAIIREIRPTIVLTHAPSDYMEDHMNTSRLAVTATFARGMRNFLTTPERASTDQETTLYHGQPHMNRDMLGYRVIPDIFVDITSCMEKKRCALLAHKSQKSWLDQSQGMDSYIYTMEDLGRELGEISGRFKFAEGWRRHFHAGFCKPNTDPLKRALEDSCHLTSNLC